MPFSTPMNMPLEPVCSRQAQEPIATAHMLCYYTRAVGTDADWHTTDKTSKRALPTSPAKSQEASVCTWRSEKWKRVLPEARRESDLVLVRSRNLASFSSNSHLPESPSP